MDMGYYIAKAIAFQSLYSNVVDTPYPELVAKL